RYLVSGRCADRVPRGDHLASRKCSGQGGSAELSPTAYSETVSLDERADAASSWGFSCRSWRRAYRLKEFRALSRQTHSCSAPQSARSQRNAGREHRQLSNFLGTSVGQGRPPCLGSFGSL